MENIKNILTAYPVLNKNASHAVVICPGGGYEFVSPREAEPVARALNERGISAFVLNYSVYPSLYPTAVLQLAAAVKHVRENAEKFGVDKDKISVMGFSAGGHLAGTLATSWQKSYVKNAFKCDSSVFKPFAAILCYPVITSGRYAHKWSFEHLLGQNKTAAEYKKLSLEKLVTKSCPPTFLWHTAADDCVPVENSLLFISALRKHKIPLEAHIYEKGRHGLSLCSKATSDGQSGNIEPHAEGWIDLAADWLKNL